LEQVEVVLGDGLRFGGIGDVLAEIREYGADRPFTEREGGIDRIGRRLTRHEARHGAPHKAVARRALAQPRAGRAGQEEISRDTHARVTSVAIVQGADGKLGYEVALFFGA